MVRIDMRQHNDAHNSCKMQEKSVDSLRQHDLNRPALVRWSNPNPTGTESVAFMHSCAKVGEGRTIAAEVQTAGLLSRLCHDRNTHAPSASEMR